MKKCKAECGLTKPLTEFSEGHHVCKKCRSQRVMAASRRKVLESGGIVCNSCKVVRPADAFVPLPGGQRPKSCIKCREGQERYRARRRKRTITPEVALLKLVHIVPADSRGPLVPMVRCWLPEAA